MLTEVRLAFYAFKWFALREREKEIIGKKTFFFFFSTSDDKGTSPAINAVIRACHVQALLGFLYVPSGHQLPSKTSLYISIRDFSSSMTVIKYYIYFYVSHRFK